MHLETIQHAIIYYKSAKKTWKATKWRDVINWDHNLSILEMVESIIIIRPDFCWRNLLPSHGPSDTLGMPLLILKDPLIRRTFCKEE